MKFNVHRVLIFIVLLVVICESKSGFKIRIDEETTCSAHTTCSQCNTDIACGWCLDTPGGSCFNATEHGQPVDFCDLWFYGTCSFEDSCEDLLTCNDCLDSKHCGFCDTVCLIGNEKGPTSNATCGQWVFNDIAQCTALNCSLQTDCVACFDIPGCAWCEDNNGHCRSHSDTSTSTSTTGAFALPICKHWSSASCPNDHLDCSKHSECSTCIEDTSGACSWCSTSNTCVRDGSTEADACANFKQKTCDDACLDFSENCTDCVRHENCLWCDDSCVMGDAAGPNYATCAEWLYGQCTAPINCSQYANCGTCTLSGCNWCESGSVNQCLPPDAQCAGSLYTNCTVVPLRCTAIRCDQCLEDNGCVWCSNGCSLASISAGTDCEMSCTQPDHGSVPGGIHEGAIIGITMGGVAVMSAIGLFVWHRLYWTKRHYYEKLG